MRDLSIIIVSFKTKDLLRDLLLSLNKYLTDAFSYEIFVVDNASGDGTVEMLESEFPVVKLIASKVNLGFAKANNRAIKQAEGKVILLLNPDTLLLKDHEFGDILKRFSTDEKIGIVGGRVFDRELNQVSSYGRDPNPLTLLLHFSLPGKILARLIPFMRRYRLANYDKSSYNIEKSVDHVNGCCFFIRKELVDRIGALDEIFFMYLEETDICKRARENEWKVIYIPKKTVIHFGQESAKQHRTKMSEQFLKSLQLFYQKHYPDSISRLQWLLKMGIVKPRIKK
jgi:GT2 family glycosyltransferase